MATGRLGIGPIPGTTAADAIDDEVSTSWSQTTLNKSPPEGYCGMAGKP